MQVRRRLLLVVQTFSTAHQPSRERLARNVAIFARTDTNRHSTTLVGAVFWSGCFAIAPMLGGAGNNASVAFGVPEILPVPRLAGNGAMKSVRRSVFL